MRLAQLAVEHSDTLEGYAVAHGMDELGELPLWRMTAFVYWYWTRNMSEEKDLQQFRSRLWQPPKGTAPDERSPWSPKNEQHAFASLKATLKK